MKSKSKRSAAAAAKPSRKSSTTPKVAGGVPGILAAFGAREGSNRAKLLSRLARDIGRPVAVPDLMTAVYGKDDGEHGKLAMVMKDAFVMIEKRKPGYKIVKSGGAPRDGVHAVSGPLNNALRRQASTR